MRTHLYYIAAIVIMGLLLWGSFLTIGKQSRENDRKEGIISALIQDTTEKAAVLRLSKKELREIAPKTAEQVKAYEKQTGGKVREIHTVKYIAGSVVHDTVFIDTVSEEWCYKPMVWEFNHGCVTNIVTYDPFNSGITDSLFGSIELSRYVLAEKPRWRIFKPRMWNKDNWPTSVRVENNCGLQIKENTIFEIQ